MIDCANQSAELLQQRTSDAANKALNIITEALTISSHSEKLLELKGDALCMVCSIIFLHSPSSFPFLFLISELGIKQAHFNIICS